MYRYEKCGSEVLQGLNLCFIFYSGQAIPVYDYALVVKIYRTYDECIPDVALLGVMTVGHSNQ